MIRFLPRVHFFLEERVAYSQNNNVLNIIVDIILSRTRNMCIVWVIHLFIIKCIFVYKILR